LQNRIALTLLAAIYLLGCASLPKAPGYSQQPILSGNPSDKTIYLPKCDEDLPESAALSCRIRLNDLYRSLVATELFREVAIGEAPDGDGAFVVDIHDFPRRPYWSTPAHNPAFLILSLGIPFWWDDALGFRFSVRELPAAREILVDTRWEGTSVMWSLASLLNVLPSRTFRSTYEQDVDRLRLALVGE
jgi:hypothetical protein